MIPTEDMREATNAAPVLPWAHIHEGDKIEFHSPGRPGTVMTVTGADEATVNYMVMALNNFENLLDHIDRPVYPDQFDDLSEDERRARDVAKIARITEDMKTWNEAQVEEDRKRDRKSFRRSALVLTLNGALIGVVTLSMAVNLIVALNR